MYLKEKVKIKYLLVLYLLRRGGMECYNAMRSLADICGVFWPVLSVYMILLFRRSLNNNWVLKF